MSNGEKPHGDEDGDVWREGPPSWDDNALCKKPIADVRDFFTSKMASEARYPIVDSLVMPSVKKPDLQQNSKLSIVGMLICEDMREAVRAELEALHMKQSQGPLTQTDIESLREIEDSLKKLDEFLLESEKNYHPCESGIDPDIARSPIRDGADLEQLIKLPGAAKLKHKYLKEDGDGESQYNREEKKDASSTNPE